jgi:hypothetical protein
MNESIINQKPELAGVVIGTLCAETKARSQHQGAVAGPKVRRCRSKARRHRVEGVMAAIANGGNSEEERHGAKLSAIVLDTNHC